MTYLDLLSKLRNIPDTELEQQILVDVGNKYVEIVDIEKREGDLILVLED